MVSSNFEFRSNGFGFIVSAQRVRRKAETEPGIWKYLTMPDTILLSAAVSPLDLRKWLERAGFAVTDHTLGSTPAVDFAPIAVAVIEVGEKLESAVVQTRRWRAELRDELVPVVWVLPAAHHVQAARGLDAGADVVLARPLDEVLFVAQVRAAARTRATERRIAAQAAEARLLGDQLRKAYAQIDRELSEARRVHRAFLPHTLPSVGAARFAVCHRPRSKAAGDFYDARRLDEHTVGFFVADVIGYETGSLLGMFVGQAVVMKETSTSGYRIISPGEVLAGVNRELIELGLDDPPLVAMVVGMLNSQTGELTVGRAGMPAPVFIPAVGEPEVWPLPGPFLGTAATSYPVRTGSLRSGDQFLIASDGTRPDGRPGPEGDDRLLLEAIARHRGLRGQAFVDAVARDLLPAVQHEQDFTLMVVEMT